MNGSPRHIRPIVALLLALNAGCGMPAKQADTPEPTVQALSSRSHIEFPTPIVLSILPFEDRTHRAELAWLRTGLADMLIADLADDPALILVQRERVEEITREQAFHVSGRVADDSVVNVGRLVGATVLLAGRAAVIGETLRLDAQMIGVERGIVLGAATAEGPVKDVAQVARQLVVKVRQLLPGHDSDLPRGLPAVDLVQTAQAEHGGEQLLREGKLFEALEEFERALTMRPNSPILQGNVDRTLKRLPPGAWSRPNQDESPERAIHRIMERLAVSFETDVGAPTLEVIDPVDDMVNTPDNTRASGYRALRIPVHIGISRPILEEALEALKQIGGASVKRLDEEDLIEVRFPSHPEFIRQLDRHTTLRRFYLRLLSGNGRTIAVYSDFRTWSTSNWIAIVDSTIRIKRGHLLNEARVDDLAPDQIEAIASLKITIDRVPLERAIVRLDAQAIPDRSERSTNIPSAEERSERRYRAVQQDAALSNSASALREFIEEAWRPPVVVSPWGHGQLPSNERVAVVIWTIDPAAQRISDGPRLVRRSGQADFDEAALAAARAGLRRWAASGGVLSPVSIGKARDAESDDAHGGPAGVKIRAHFQLRVHVPALNLIGPLMSDPTSAPLPSHAHLH